MLTAWKIGGGGTGGQGDLPIATLWLLQPSMVRRTKQVYVVLNQAVGRYHESFSLRQALHL